MLTPNNIYFIVCRTHDETLQKLTALNDVFITNKYGKPSFTGFENSVKARSKYWNKVTKLEKALKKYSMTEYDLIPF